MTFTGGPINKQKHFLFFFFLFFVTFSRVSPTAHCEESERESVRLLFIFFFPHVHFSVFYFVSLSCCVSDLQDSLSLRPNTDAAHDLVKTIVDVKTFLLCVKHLRHLRHLHQPCKSSSSSSPSLDFYHHNGWKGLFLAQQMNSFVYFYVVLLCEVYLCDSAGCSVNWDSVILPVDLNVPGCVFILWM